MNDERKIETVISPAFLVADEIRKKKRDYGGISDYFPFGDKSFVQMLHVKVKRLINLAELETPPQNEPVEDSIIDLINYASYYWEWRKGILDE